MRYTLKDDGYPTFKKIMVGKKWVGRVGRHAEGGFVGTIGNETVRAETEIAAFEEISARHMGFPNAAALKAKNAAVRRRNGEQRAYAKYAVGELLRGNFEPLDRVLGIPPGRSK